MTLIRYLARRQIRRSVAAKVGQFSERGRFRSDETSQFLVDLVPIESFGIEDLAGLQAQPLPVFLMLFVAQIVDCLNNIPPSPGAATVFRRRCTPARGAAREAARRRRPSKSFPSVNKGTPWNGLLLRAHHPSSRSGSTSISSSSVVTSSLRGILS